MKSTVLYLTALKNKREKRFPWPKKWFFLALSCIVHTNIKSIKETEKQLCYKNYNLKQAYFKNNYAIHVRAITIIIKINFILIELSCMCVGTSSYISTKYLRSSGTCVLHIIDVHLKTVQLHTQFNQSVCIRHLCLTIWRSNTSRTDVSIMYVRVTYFTLSAQCIIIYLSRYNKKIIHSYIQSG